MKTRTEKKRRAGSQCDRLLAAFQRGERLTRMTSARKYKVLNTWQRVRELRDAGHPIEREYVVKNGSRYAVYFLADADSQFKPEGLPS